MNVPHDASDERLGRAAARSIGWVAIDKWGTRFSSLLVLTILGRLLAPADFGVVALASSFVALAGVVVDQGFGKVLIQRRDVRPEHIDTAFSTALGVALLLMATMLLCAPLLEQLMNAPGLAAVVRWMAVAVVIHALAGTPAALLERSLQFKSLALRRLASTLAGGIAAVAVALAGGGVWSLVAQSLAGAVVGLAVLWAAAAEWRPKLAFDVGAFRELWPLGIGIFAIELTGFVNSQADRLIVGAFLTAEDLGFYYMAMRIISIMVELFSSIFSTVSLSLFSRVQDDRRRLLGWLYRLAGASSAVTLPCFAIAAILAPVLIPFVLGASWAPSVRIFQILSFLGAINAIAYFDRSVLLAIGRPRAAFLITLGQSAVGVLFALVATRWGVLAVALAVVARQYLYWPVRLWVLRRTVGVDPLSYVGQWLRPFGASSVMLAALYAIVWRWPLLASVPAVYAAGVGIVGLAVYLLVLRSVHRDAFTDIRAAFHSLRQGGA